MSNNSFSGTIRRCLIEMSRTLGVLNLRTNNLNSKILDAFSDNCSLQILALIKNQLEKGYQNLWSIALGWRSWTLGTTL
jgi:hypothetical protein